MGEYPFTIEQLAAETGLSVRNLRSHRARGLLQPPVVRDRVGYYGAEHVERVSLVVRLQGEGFNLAAIKAVVDGSEGDVLRVVEVASRPFETEESRVFTAAELAERFRVDDPAEVIELAAKAGLLVDLGDGRWEAPAPSVLDVGEELAARGVPIRHSLVVAGKVRTATRTVAKEFVRLALDDLWEPFAADGYPPERWAELAEAIERLRPMSAQVVLAMFQMTMSDEVERGIETTLADFSKRGD